jgi:putative tryptophan/tyrosine transport system substrate-binding protein
VNNRRKLVLALGASALAAPFGSFAQQPGKVWRIGVLSPRIRPKSLESDSYDRAFVQGMRELGYVEGKNILIEWRYADAKYERLLELAAELVRLKVDVIVTTGTTATRAVHEATTTIPIVLASGSDLASAGLVNSLARPGGNVTGFSNVGHEISVKHLEILRDMVPRLSSVAMLVNPANSGHAPLLKSVQAAAQRIGMTIVAAEAPSAQKIADAFSVKKKLVGALIVANEPFFIQQARQIAELALKHRLPSIAAFREYVEVGLLASYGPNVVDTHRRAATYVDKILKGAKPGELPVQQPTIFEMFINMKTAKALGIKVPQSILVRADTVIE